MYPATVQTAGLQKRARREFLALIGYDNGVLVESYPVVDICSKGVMSMTKFATDLTTKNEKHYVKETKLP